MSIVINIEKAKSIAHQKRRHDREEEFKPFDELIAKNIPGVSFSETEAARQKIRDKYALMQNQIDNATSVDEIKLACGFNS